MKNYQKWEIKRWDTPLSDLVCTNLILKELKLWERGLTLVLENEANIFTMHFNAHPPFRVINEGFRGDLLIKLNQEGKLRLGDTLTVKNSDFEEFLR